MFLVPPEFLLPPVVAELSLPAAAPPLAFVPPASVPPPSLSVEVEVPPQASGKSPSAENKAVLKTRTFALSIR